MGRMLEALKSEAPRPAAKDRPFFEDTFEHIPSADPVAIADAVDDGIPFIEVGPNKKIEGSAQVMAFKHPAQTRMQPPHQPAEKIAQLQPTMHAELLPAKPLGVAFEPWPTLPRLGQGIAPEIITFHHPENAVSKQYAALAAKMQDGPGPRVLLFTGCRSQVGTSTVLLNLAVALAAAQLGHGKIAVVDAHVRRPCLAQRLGYVSAAGLQDVLQGKLALEQAVVQTSIAGLSLIAAQPAAAAIPLRAEAVRWLFSWLSEHFCTILVDGPPLDAGSDLPVLASASDGTYLVVPHAEDPQSQRSLAQTVTATGARLRGLFHTRCD